MMLLRRKWQYHPYVIIYETCHTYHAHTLQLILQQLARSVFRAASSGGEEEEEGKQE